MNEIESKSGVTVDGISRFFDYLVRREGSEPIISNDSSEFVSSLTKDFKENHEDVLILLGSEYRYSETIIKPSKDRDCLIDQFFDINSRHIYSLASDIVEKSDNITWVSIAGAITSNLKDPSIQRDVDLYCQRNLTDFTVLNLKSLIEGDVIDDSSALLDLKAELLKYVTQSFRADVFHIHDVMQSIKANKKRKHNSRYF